VTSRKQSVSWREKEKNNQKNGLLNHFIQEISFLEQINNDYLSRKRKCQRLIILNKFNQNFFCYNLKTSDKSVKIPKNPIYSTL
jgi:hypothetical protein